MIFSSLGYCIRLSLNEVKFLTKFIGKSNVDYLFNYKPILPLLSKIPQIEYASLHSSSITNFREDHETKSLAVLDNIRQVKHSPFPALILGLSGLVPFVSSPLYMISCGVFMPSIAYIQLAYGASILSFIGGIRWGLTLPQASTQSPDWHNLGYSVVPSIIAWSSLIISPTIGLISIMGGLALTGYMDIAMWGYPNWFKGMRFCLTFVAILSLWTTLMCRFILTGEKEIKTEEVK